MYAKRSLVTVKDDGLDRIAVYDYGSGRLSYLRQNVIVMELHPPHSWTYIATVANNEHWGTRPTRADLMTVLKSFQASETRHVGANSVRKQRPWRYARRLTKLLRVVPQMLAHSLGAAMRRARLDPRGAIR
jgi:hypothetical protein